MCVTKYFLYKNVSLSKAKIQRPSTNGLTLLFLSQEKSSSWACKVQVMMKIWIFIEFLIFNFWLVKNLYSFLSGLCEIIFMRISEERKRKRKCIVHIETKKKRIRLVYRQKKIFLKLFKASLKLHFKVSFLLYGLTRKFNRKMKGFKT